MLRLNEKLLLAKGGERDCYLHPEDKTKVIKVLHKEENHNNQNELERDYYNYLEKKDISYENITKSYGYINTNLGKGLVFDRIVNYDGTECKSFRYMMVHKLVSLEEQEKMILELKNYIEENQILFMDTSLTNIFCPKISENKHKLIIVDGLGAKRFGPKYWLCKNFRLYMQYKMYKQWRKFIKNYNSDIQRIKSGNNPIKRV